MILIKTQRDTLLAPLQSVSGIVEKRHTLPILSNVLLEKKGDLLTLLATDIEIQITTSTQGANGDGDGAVTVGARKLQDILRSLPDSAEVRVSSVNGSVCSNATIAAAALSRTASRTGPVRPSSSSRAIPAFTCASPPWSAAP